MNILVVSSYPPMPCGIGAYAEQQVISLRREGHVVDVYSPPEGDGDARGSLVGGWRILRLAKWVWAYDEIAIQFTPSFFFHYAKRFDRLQTSLAWLIFAVLFGRGLRVIIHETEYRLNEGKPEGGLRRWIDRWTWKLCRRIIFHSSREREAFAEYYKFPADSPRLELQPHDHYFIPYCRIERNEARQSLGIENGRTLLVCIGFVQPHKGYDRVIRALREVDAAELMLRVVGSVRINWEPALEYAKELHRLAAQDARTEFIETFVSNELFDAWIAASDYVVVPYHFIWSSGVAARAKLYDRPLIVSDSGGLREQMNAQSYCFRTDEELVGILREIASSHRETKITMHPEERARNDHDSGFPVAP